MQSAGRQTQGPLFSGSQCCGGRQQTPEQEKRPREKGSHPSAREKEKARGTAAQDFIHKDTEKTKTDLTLPALFLVV